VLPKQQIKTPNSVTEICNPYNCEERSNLYIGHSPPSMTIPKELNILPVNDLKKIITISIAYRDNLFANADTAALDAVNFVERYDV
jgi:hypothetical protein